MSEPSGYPVAHEGDRLPLPEVGWVRLDCDCVDYYLRRFADGSVVIVDRPSDAYHTNPADKSYRWLLRTIDQWEPEATKGVGMDRDDAMRLAEEAAANPPPPVPLPEGAWVVDVPERLGTAEDLANFIMCLIEKRGHPPALMRCGPSLRQRLDPKPDTDIDDTPRPRQGTIILGVPVLWVDAAPPDQCQGCDRLDYLCASPGGPLLPHCRPMGKEEADPMFLLAFPRPPHEPWPVGCVKAGWERAEKR